MRILLYLLLLPVLWTATIAHAKQRPPWNISPEQINLKRGESCPLQALDAGGNEVAIADWSVSNAELATISREDGRTVVYAKAPGNVEITASVAGEIRTRHVVIWPDDKPVTGFRWSAGRIGRDISVVQAVPTNDGPDFYSLSNNGGRGYVRAFSIDGIQRWRWMVPKGGHSVELVCGDNAGGLILAVSRSDSYTVYGVGKDGKLQWRRTFQGKRRGYALGDVLLLATQSRDRNDAAIAGVDDNGKVPFEVRLPQSIRTKTGFRRSGQKLLCSPDHSSVFPIPSDTSGLFIGSDGDAHLAFTQTELTETASQCIPGSTLDHSKITNSTSQKLILWRIHPDGTKETYVVEETKHAEDQRKKTRIPSPTGGIIPDGSGGILLAVSFQDLNTQTGTKGVRDGIYRIDSEGKIVFLFKLPFYTGPRYDEMVLGDKNQGFAVRGQQLISFRISDGAELWHWDSGINGIRISMATEGGGCLIDTPNGMVLVEEGSARGTIAPSHSDFWTPGKFLRINPVGLWQTD